MLVVFAFYLSCVTVDPRNTVDIRAAKNCMKAKGNVLRQADDPCVLKLKNVTFYATLKKIEQLYSDQFYAVADLDDRKDIWCNFDSKNKDQMKEASALVNGDRVVLKGDLVKIDTYISSTVVIDTLTLDSCLITKDQTLSK